MNKNQFLFILFLLYCLINSWKTDVQNDTVQSEIPQKEIRNYLIQELGVIVDHLSESTQQIDDEIKLRSLYHQSRKHYKHIEFFIEHFSPKEAKYSINGALVPKYIEEFDPPIVYPQGFQKIEELLFTQEVLDKSALLKEFSQLSDCFQVLKNYYQLVDIDSGLLLEMCQLQLFRIASMSLNGYDATITKTNLQEINWSLEGMIVVIHSCKTIQMKDERIVTTQKKLIKSIQKAQKELAKNTDYDSFNRLRFIVNHIKKINKGFITFHNACGLTWNMNKQALHLDRDNLFAAETFNPQFFSIYYNDTLNIKDQAELGKILFYDPILSANNQRSCSSCHNPKKAFTDGVDRSTAFDQKSKLSRNAPTLLNVIYQKAFFHDGRVYQLEQQAFDVVHNKEEMGSDMEDVVLKLRKSKEYRGLFERAFPNTMDAKITIYAIQKAITEYEKTLIAFNSRFDKYIKGNRRALTKREISGYNVFAGKGLCGSCHFFPLFNGTVPPSYSESEYEIIGTPSTKENKILDSDIGRFLVTKLNEHNYAFKTPTVRNVELTAPYMHNGVYPTLEDVIEFYHKGGGKGFKYAVENQTLPFDSLEITKREKENMILFLKSLTDTSSFQKPTRFDLPHFENEPIWNQRNWGGEY